MKKLFLLLIICLSLLSNLHANNNDNIFGLPERALEFGFNFNLLFSNNYLTIAEVLKRTIVINLDDLKKGLKVNIGAGFTPFYFYQNKTTWGWGVSVDIDAQGFLGLSGNMLTLSEANKDKSEVGGAVFVSAAIDSFSYINSFKFKFKPAAFFTAAFIKPDISYTFLNSEDGTRVNIVYDLHVYSAFPMNDFPNNFVITGSPGLDISMGLEYHLSKEIGLSEILPFLDFSLGIDLINIPIIPSSLTDYMRMEGMIGSNDPFYVIGNTGGLGDFVTSLGNSNPVYSYGKKRIELRRPFKALVWAVWKPFFGTNFIVVKPVLGFSYSTLHIEPLSFEGGLNVGVNLLNMLVFRAGINYVDRLWINSLDFTFSLKLFQLDVGVDLRSTEFIEIWKTSGVGLRVGVRFGW
ncbi:MAG: hypothetical protein FWD28_09780 [Treponema sp.]|nr:hypothetical protein [Treponema sp.]